MGRPRLLPSPLAGDSPAVRMRCGLGEIIDCGAVGVCALSSAEVGCVEDLSSESASEDSVSSRRTVDGVSGGGVGYAEGSVSMDLVGVMGRSMGVVGSEEVAGGVEAAGDVTRS